MNMKSNKHIKSFNEAIENFNISNVRSSKSHLDFLDEFVEKMNKLRDESKKKGYIEDKDIDFIEDLYSTYSFYYDTDERFVKN
jgi:lipoate-protein ligase A